jgi:thiamine phosphate synthase YjbQ (UPF0047 family)
MKSYHKGLGFNLPTRRAFMIITPQVEECLRENRIREKLVVYNGMHTPALVSPRQHF